MQFVGGYAGLVALRGNAQDYDDVLVAMAGEADARRILRSQAGTRATSNESSLGPVMSWPVGEEPPATKQAPGSTKLAGEAN